MKKLTMMLLQTLALALVAAPFAAAGKDCITDVMVVGGADKSVTNSYASQGWKVIPQDLNAGAGGDWIFLLYKAADSASVSNGFITGFYIKTGAVTNELTHAGRGYHLVPCAGSESFVEGKGNLNNNTRKQGDNIHLYYTRSTFPDNRVVTSINFNDTQDGAVGKNGGTTGYDLNSRAEGDFIYMHVSTAALPYAPGVSYLDPMDPASPEKVRHGYMFITNQTELPSGWYVVAGAVTNDSRITVSGDVNIILTDGAELAANGGVNLEEGNRLTIWAQSTHAVAGRLLARGGNDQAGIGGDYGRASGALTINGGKVEAHGGFRGAGIGGGAGRSGGMVTINGGMVEAHGGNRGAGIGGGELGTGGEVTVNGGTVEAHGGEGGEAIGAGAHITNDDGSLSIDGMKVGYVESDGKVHEWAASNERDGCCRNRESKTVRIEVCSPHAYEGGNCKLCGETVHYLDPTDPETPEIICQDFTFITNQTELSSGWYVVAGAVTNDSRIFVSGDVNLILMDRAELAANSGVTVEGENRLTIWAQSTNAVAGKLTAWGGNQQAGIGGGKSRAGGEVTVNGGMVKAYGGEEGAGIGGGTDGAGGMVTINGGTVEAHGGIYAAGIGGGKSRAGGEVTVNGGTVEAYGGSSGAGIGGGCWGWWGGILTVNSGTVVAHGAPPGMGIGGGWAVTDYGSLFILGMAVYDADTSETPVAFGEREAVCRSSWAKITPCPYIDEVHDFCPYCGFGHLAVGEYCKATLSELGYEVPTIGTVYSVKAYGLPAGLKLKYNAAVKKKVKGKWKKVVVKAAKSEWWIEGVPTAALDYKTNPAYLAITTNGVTVTVPIYLDVFAQNVTELGTFPLGKVWNAEDPLYLPGVTNGWTVSGLPKSLKYTAKLLTTTKKKGKKVVSVTTNALPYSVYGKVAKAGLFTITAKKKNGAYNETMKYRVLITPATPDPLVFGENLTNITTMAYVPFEWNLTNNLPSMAKVTGLPGGVTFASANVYYDKKKTKLKQAAQTIVGTPTKSGTYVVTFTKNVTTGTGKKKKTVAKTAQILWKIVANDAEVELGFNTAGGVVDGGMAGFTYGDLLAFEATGNATVKASGLPAGITLSNLGDGQYAFTGSATKAGTYLVTVTATLNGKTVRQRLLLEVDGLPTHAKGSFYGKTFTDPITVTGSNFSLNMTNVVGLATMGVTSAGKISGKFQVYGTNWTFSAGSYAWVDEWRVEGHVVKRNQAVGTLATARYAYKEKVKVKGKWKTVTRTLTRDLEVNVDGSGVLVHDPVDGVSAYLHQDLWGSTYKQVGQKVFVTGKKKYRDYKYTVDVGGKNCPLTVNVTTAGKATVTLKWNTGKKKNGKWVYYTPSCSTVVYPTGGSAADLENFTGEVNYYFAPNANGFPGVGGAVGVGVGY